jgi:hypothetical protein
MTIEIIDIYNFYDLNREAHSHPNSANPSANHQMNGSFFMTSACYLFKGMNKC